MDDIIKENKNNPEAMKAINKILKRSKDDSDVNKKVKLHSNPKKKRRSKDDSAITEKAKKKQKELIRQELDAWAEKNEPEEGWGLTNKRYKEIRLRKKYMDYGETGSWIEYLQNSDMEITREIYKKGNCLVTINVDGEIWGNVEYHGIVNNQNISNYIENNHLPEALKINTESSNVEIIREKQSLKRRALGIKVNFNITTKEKFISKTVEKCKMQHQKLVKKSLIIDIIVDDDKKPIRIKYEYIGKFNNIALIKYIKDNVWPEEFSKTFGSSEKFDFHVEILKKQRRD